MFNLSPTAIFLTRLAGISGALAVALGAYGSHVIRNKDLPEDRKFAFETANRYHMLHTLALLAMPLTRRPALSGSLIGVGMILFCGACYSYSITGNTYVTQFAPYGGMLLIIGWISMVF